MCVSLVPSVKQANHQILSCGNGKINPTQYWNSDLARAKPLPFLRTHGPIPGVVGPQQNGLWKIAEINGSDPNYLHPLGWLSKKTFAFLGPTGFSTAILTGEESDCLIEDFKEHHSESTLGLMGSNLGHGWGPTSDNPKMLVMKIDVFCTCFLKGFWRLTYEAGLEMVEKGWDSCWLVITNMVEKVMLPFHYCR